MAPAPRKPTPEALEALLDQAASAFDDHEYEQVRALADQVLKADPQNVDARHLRAAALVELGEPHDALDEYERALKLAPDDPDLLLETSELLVCRPGDDRTQVERGLSLAAKGKKLARRAKDADLEFEFLLLEGTGLNQLGECQRALARLEEALERVPGSKDAALERAVALFELCRFADAQKALESLVGHSPEDPWVHHYLGLIAERRGDVKKAKAAFARAQSLSPEDFPPPVHLDDEAFDQAVEEAIAQLPAHVKQYLDNATIAVEPIPSDDDLKAGDPPLSPTILGVFSGMPVGHRSVTNAADHATASIVLYQRNLERFARTREELIEQIGITVMHEVGHLIGLDEDELSARGLE